MRVLIVPDKFKGTLTATHVAESIAHGWRRGRPDDTLDLLPMSDGGDGFGDVMSMLLGARSRRVLTVDAAHRPLHTRWWWEKHTRTAIIESAVVIGLAMLPPKRFHPYELDTQGLGTVLAGVARWHPRRCFIGIGGSATNDGGFGMARALGWRFLTRKGDDIINWTDLAGCRQAIPPKQRLTLGRLTVALDVQNQLLGTKGCTRVYGPQKGLLPREFRRAEFALRQLADVMSRRHGTSLAGICGAGAAGGLGFGLMTFLNARPVPGVSLFARQSGLEKRIRAADLVITGEGAFDSQSLMGKGVGVLAALCRQHGIPFIVIAGSAWTGQGAPLDHARVYSLDRITSKRQALSGPGYWLRQAAAMAATDWNAQGFRRTANRRKDSGVVADGHSLDPG